MRRKEMTKIGITERGDAALDTSWLSWVNEGKPAILITKDPGKLSQYLKTYMNIIVHCTITGYGGGILEPNVPTPGSALRATEKLCENIGMERVVLRIDPIIPTPKGQSIANKIMDEYLGFGHPDASHRVRISFIDQYSHVKERFTTAGLKLPWDSFHAPLETRKVAWGKMDRIPEVCGEPGFQCTGCISVDDCCTLEVDGLPNFSAQRRACTCLANKHELLSTRGQCAHGCLYCYWR
jgi:DNA repair photolyase